MKKTFEYKGATTEIRITLFAETERSMNGDSFHYVEADFFEGSRKINSKNNLEDQVIAIERDFMDRIDEKEKRNVSKEVSILQSLGYTE